MIPLPKLHIAVLMGGSSNEREISLMSGNGVAEALEGRGHKVTRLDLDQNITEKLLAIKPDVVFNALHGVPGEDGSVQGMLDLMQLPYTHSGVATSAIAIDKQLTKSVLERYNIPFPQGIVVQKSTLFKEDPLPRPYVLKPLNEGSSLGVAIISAESIYGCPISENDEGPWKQFSTLLAEPFIKGRELTTAVIDLQDGPVALGVTELIIEAGFYDYEHKYTEGKTVHVCPADLPDQIRDKCEAFALKAHIHLGCRGVSRTDFRWNEELGEEGIFVLEVNTQPGMTPLSLVPEQATRKGFSYSDLVEILIYSALQNYAPEKLQDTGYADD